MTNAVFSFFVESFIFHLSNVAPPCVIRISPYSSLILYPSSCGNPSWREPFVNSFVRCLFSSYCSLCFSMSVNILISLIISWNVSPVYYFRTILTPIVTSRPKKTTAWAELELDRSTVILSLKNNGSIVFYFSGFWFSTIIFELARLYFLNKFYW